MTLPPLDELKQLQAQHTPGPWRASPIPGRDTLHYITNPTGVVIPRDTSSQAGEANTRLTCYAPDLLAEVIRMRERVADARDMARQLSENPTIMTTEQHLFADIADELDETIGEHQ